MNKKLIIFSLMTFTSVWGAKEVRKPGRPPKNLDVQTTGEGRLALNLHKKECRHKREQARPELARIRKEKNQQAMQRRRENSDYGLNERQNRCPVKLYGAMFYRHHFLRTSNLPSVRENVSCTDQNMYKQGGQALAQLIAQVKNEELYTNQAVARIKVEAKKLGKEYGAKTESRGKDLCLDHDENR